MQVYNDYRLHLIIGFWLSLALLMITGATCGVTLVCSIGGLAPLFIGLSKVLSGVEFSYFPSIMAIVCCVFIP